MQIHEITIVANQKIPKLNEDLKDSLQAYYDKLITQDPALAGLDIKQKTARFAQQRMIKELAEKAWSKWQVFDNAELFRRKSDPVKLAAYTDRSDQMYEKNLLAFTMQNLLPGKSLSTLTNGQEIKNIVTEISTPMAPAGTNTPENQLAKFTELISATAMSQTAGDVDSAEKQLAAIGREILAKPGTVTTGSKTGNPTMDKALTDLGFTLT